MRGGATVSWSSPPVAPALAPPWDDPTRPAQTDDEEAPLLPRPDRSPFAEVAPIASEAVRVRAHVQQARREAGLRRLGVRVVRVRHAVPAQASELAEGEAPAAAASG